MATRSYRGVCRAGLKFVSQILFVKHEETKTIEIGFPTDVKHVAHIGFDGPSSGNGPSWMTDFKTGPDFATSLGNPISNDSKASPKFSSQDTDQSRRAQGASDGQAAADPPVASKKQRRKKRSTSSLKTRSRPSRRSKATSVQLESKLDLED